MKTVELVHTTKPFMTGRCQAIRIPKEYRLSDEEVIVTKIGDALMITPKSKAKEAFFAGTELLTEDFMFGGKPQENRNDSVVDSLGYQKTALLECLGIALYNDNHHYQRKVPEIPSWQIASPRPMVKTMVILSDCDLVYNEKLGVFR